MREAVLAAMILAGATVSAAAGAKDDKVVAIDILLDPDSVMIERAQALNARLRQDYPQGYTLGAGHAPHVSLVQRYVRAFCQAVYRFRTDAAFGVGVLANHTGERDRGVLEQSWLLFARLMGGMMFPSVEGMRNAAGVLYRLGALPRLVPPEEAVDLSKVAELEREGFFDRTMGLRSDGGGA